ncbi:MAG: hypothetical protein HN769_13500 [Anaerolineae bacterium]|nr:hypothetical protein [Anaerolineae bacterium]
MTKKIFPLIFLVAILLSACGAQTPEASTATPSATVSPATNTPKPTSTPASDDTPTPESEATIAPTATEIPPENAADCINEAAFVSDVTIPDNSDLNADQAFTKTWRIRNTGTCIWWSGYRLSHYSESALGAAESVPLPRTNAGETADISIELIAPDTAGTYQGNFVVKNPDGLIMKVDNDSRLWVIFNVGNTTAAGNTPTGSGSKASCAFTTDAPLTDQLLAVINAYRVQSGVRAYTINQELAEAAQEHAADMACNQLFVHVGSDGSTPQTRSTAAGYSGAKVTENVYGSYPPLSPEEVKDWWRLDQVDINHNKNLISTQYTEVGIGYAFFNNYGYYVVVFGVP